MYTPRQTASYLTLVEFMCDYFLYDLDAHHASRGTLPKLSTMTKTKIEPASNTLWMID